MAKTEKTRATEYVHTAAYLNKKAAKSTLHSAVQVMELAENYVQAVYNAGYEANYEGLKVAKGYWEATSEIRQDWVKLFEKTGNEIIDATANIRFPSTSEVAKIGENAFGGMAKIVEGFVAPMKASAK